MTASQTTAEPSSDSEDPRPRAGEAGSRRRIELFALALIVILAAALRFTGIDHDLRYRGPTFDESNNFVEPVLRMWKEGTPNPGPYAGYPGFFNHLLFFPVGLGFAVGGEPGAYTAARAVIASFGVLSVVLLHRLARPLFGPPAALMGAALLAFSRGEVREAHFISPDVVVVAAMLGVLLLLNRPHRERRHDLWAAALTGATIAVKYTGLFLLPGLFAGLLASGRLRTRLLPAVAVAALSFVAAAPFAVIHPGEGGMFLGEALHHYYEPRAGTPGDGAAANVLAAVVLNMGVPGVVLAALGLALLPWRVWLPAAALALCAVAVMANAQLVYGRHVLVASAAATVLAAGGLSALLARARPWPARLLVVVLPVFVLAVPARRSFRVTARFLEPSTVQQVIQWFEQSQRKGLIASSHGLRGLPRSHLEVRYFESLPGVGPAVLAHYDFLVASGAAEPEAVPGFAALARFAPLDGAGPALTVLAPAPGTKPVLAPAGKPETVATNEGAGCAPAAWDGDMDTACLLPPGSSWLEAVWTAPLAVARVEILLARDSPPFAQDFEVAGLSFDGSGWEGLPAIALRPTRVNRQRQDQPHGQVLVIPAPRPLRGLRVRRGQGPSWTTAEIRVFVHGRPFTPAARGGRRPAPRPVRQG